MEDQRAVQEVLWACAREAHGSAIAVSDSPLRSPDRKKSRTDDGDMGELEAELENMIGEAQVEQERHGEEGNPLGLSCSLDQEEDDS